MQVALSDGTASVRREALQACLERTMLECIPAALVQWQNEGGDPGVRIAALRVLALAAAATPAHGDRLLAALRDQDEAVRAEATYTLARVPWPDDQLLRVRTALIAKLADTAPPVRRAAARSLGLLGPPPIGPATRSAAATPGGAPADPATRSSQPGSVLASPAMSTSPASASPPAPAGATPPTAAARPTPNPARDAASRVADPAPLALARLLTDPDPQVRQDAAEALGNLRDPRAAPPLLRALEAGDEVYVSRAMVLALGALPGPEVDAALLRLLDVPPRGLTHRNVSEALGRRPAPSPALIDGLVARIREETLQPFVIEALLLLGGAAAPALREAQARGLEPPLALAVGRLLAALAPPPRPPVAAPWPPSDDVEAWQQRLADPGEGLRAAQALAADPPAWLGLAAVAAVSRAGPVERRPWLLALAAAPRPLLPEADAVVHARLAGWVGDAGLAPLDRCLALAALGRAARGNAPLLARTLAAAAADVQPALRSCAAATARDDELLAGLLRDPSPRVRAVASYTVAACPVRPSSTTQALLARLASEDPQPGVIRAARAAITRLQNRERIPACTWALLDAGDLRPRAPLDGLAWADLRWRGHDLRLPALPMGEHRWLLLPAIGEAELAAPPETPTAPRALQ